MRALMVAPIPGQKYAADLANRADVIGFVARETKQDLALVEAIWDQYAFSPAFGKAYVANTCSMAEYLVASGRFAGRGRPDGLHLHHAGLGDRSRHGQDPG